MVIEACPITDCSRFGVHPNCSMNKLAAACRKECHPYLGRYAGEIPAAACNGPSTRSRKLGTVQGLPTELGNTRLSSPRGQRSFHSRNVLTTSGARGMSRFPARLFG